MRLITREELKECLDRGDEVTVVCALGERAYRAAHIPGSTWCDGPDHALATLGKDEAIIVYCSNVHCPASVTLYNFLVQSGYTNVCRYAGGIEDWEAAGYPLVMEQTGTVAE